MGSQPRVTVENIVAKFNVGKPLNIHVIAWVLFTAENRAGSYNNRFLQFRNEDVTLRFYDSGKAIAFNAKSLENLRTRCRNAAQIIQNVAQSSFHNYRLVSITGTGKIRRDINLESLAALNKEIVVSISNGTAKCDFAVFGSVVRVHKSGSLVVIGKDMKKMELAVLEVEKMAKVVWRKFSN